MSTPIDIVLCFHNAFRRDIAQIDSLVFDIARSGGDLLPVLDRLHIIDEILDYHARVRKQRFFPRSTTSRLLQLGLLDGSSGTQQNG